MIDAPDGSSIGSRFVLTVCAICHNKCAKEDSTVSVVSEWILGCINFDWTNGVKSYRKPKDETFNVIAPSQPAAFPGRNKSLLVAAAEPGKVWMKAAEKWTVTE